MMKQALALIGILAMSGSWTDSLIAQQVGVGSSLTGEFVDREAPIELTFDRSLSSAERTAVFIGDTDVSDLFERTAEGLRYAPTGLPLPAGQTELVVYLVAEGGAWNEVGRFPLNVLSRFGFQPATYDPSVSVSYSRRVSDGNNEGQESQRPDPRLNVEISVQTEHVREGFKVRTQSSFVGVRDRTQALRYGTLEDDAPRLDLSNYVIQFSGGPFELSVGNVSIGNQRHLVNNFSSRGAALALRPHSRVDLSLGVVNGSSLVGYENILGFSTPDHQLMSGSVGVDAFTEPGRLRIEVSGLSASVLPISGFNQGALNDAEQSRGGAVRVTANLLDRRLRLDAGLAKSAFENPEDVDLDQGFDVVAVAEETRAATYLEASLDAIRALRLGESRTARLSLGYRFEKVDPQYRTLGAYAQADRRQDNFSAQADIAGVGLQTGFSKSRNNVDDIPSLLTSDTRQANMNASVPLAQILGKQTAWLPSFSYQWGRTSQGGRVVPENGGFSASHVPDQVSVNRTASANWNTGRLGVGLRWNESHQDNRQEGRENADFLNTTKGITWRFSPWSRLSVNVDLGRESALSLERDEEDLTTRYGVQANVQVFTQTRLSLGLSNSAADNNVGIRTQENRNINAQLSSILPWVSRFDGQWNLRFSHNKAEVFDLFNEELTDRRQWTLDAGLSLRFF